MRERDDDGVGAGLWHTDTPAAAMAVAARIDFWVDLLPGVEPGNDSSNAAVVLLL